jgi:hypothetical protein
VVDNVAADLEDYKPTQSYLPLYYNAWGNDIFSDSLVTLLGALVAEAESDSFGKVAGKTKEKITALVDALLKPFGLDGVTELVNAFSKTDLLDSMKDIKNIQSNIKELINVLLCERAEKLVLFVDELDRCSPAFALKLLEQIKFMFTMDNVVIVFSTNVTQLARTVQGYYGAGFNGNEYLTRYYDIKVELMKVRPADFFNTKWSF